MPATTAPDPPPGPVDLPELQRLALEASGTGLWTWDVATDEVTWTSVCYELLGVDPAAGSLTFANFIDRAHPDDRGALQSAVAASLAEGSHFDHTFRVLLPDGDVRWLANHGRTLHAADGRAARMLGSVRDVTQQRRVEQRYVESEERLSLALESSGLGIWTWDLPSGRVTWSDPCYRIHGLRPDEFDGTGDAFFALVHPEDRERVGASVRQAISERTPYISEFRIVRPNGEVAWVSNRGQASYAADGQPLCVVGTIGDITTLKQTATALHAALGASHTGTFHWNILTNALTWDDELHRLFGLSPDSDVRSLDQFLSLVHPDDRTRVIEACERCRDVGADFDLEYRVILPDGAGVRWLYDRGLTFRDAAGRPAWLTGACVDITARVASDRALAFNRARLDYATRLSGVGFWYCDLPFDVLEWDDRVKEHFFFAPSDRITIDDFYRRIHEEDRDATRAAIETSVRMRTPYDIVYRTVHPDSGAVKWIRALGGTDYAPDGTPTHFDGVTVDMTAQKVDQQKLSVLNDQLRAQDRLKDEFIATLSHELRNPMAPIRAAAQMLATPDLPPLQQRRAHEIIRRQVAHMSLLLDDLLDIARITQGKLTLRKRSVPLAEVIESAVEAVRPILDAKGHRLSVDLPAGSASIEADPLRMSQVLANLLTNAAKYSDPGGHIQVTARVEDRTLSLSVKDHGIGIPPESLEAIFEMFTQATAGRGMADGGLGIGLALVKNLVALHGGTVVARSDGLKKGSEFVVVLPVVEASPAGTTDVPTPAAEAGVRSRILIADDNQDAAETLRWLLEMEGHDVKVAHSGEAALTLAALFKPDTMVLDIGMPDLTGYEVAERVRKEAWGHGTQLIALTGWGQEQDRFHALQSGFDEHLIKPVAPDILADLIQRRQVGPG